MTKIKYLISLVEHLCLSIWGLTVLEIIPFIDIDLFSTIDNTIKTLMALFGALYFLIQLPFKVRELYHKQKVNKIELKMKIQLLEKQIKENQNLKNKKDE